MRGFSPGAVRVEMASAMEAVRQAQAERQYPVYIGLDTQKVVGCAVRTGSDHPAEDARCARRILRVLRSNISQARLVSIPDSKPCLSITADRSRGGR